MDKSLISQIERAKELLKDLEESIQADLASQDVSDRTLNLTQEILVKMRGILDQSQYKFFKAHYLPILSEADSKKAKVYFPIVSKKEDLSSILGRAQMGDLEKKYPTFFQFLNSVQPYNTRYKWLSYLAEYSNEKHIRLSPQSIKTESETTLGGVVSVRGGTNVSMRDVLINGIPVNSRDLSQEPLENFNPKLNAQRRIWTKLTFEGTQIDSLELCKRAVFEGEKLAKKISSSI